MAGGEEGLRRGTLRETKASPPPHPNSASNSDIDTSQQQLLPIVGRKDKMVFWSVSPPFTVLLVVVFAFCLSRPGALVAGDPVIAQRYPISQWSDAYRCPDLQVNRTAACIITDKKIYIFSGITREEEEDEAQILIGEVDLKSAFSLDTYQIEWWTSLNFTDGVYFVAGEESQLIFNVEQRVGYGVSNATSSLVTYNPASHGLDTIAWPSEIPEKTLPVTGISINVPLQKTTYYVGSQGSVARGGSPVELFAYNYADGSVVRKALPPNSWASMSFIDVGKKGILVMLGGVDAAVRSPLPMDTVYVYDIATDKGFLQPTTGVSPSSRLWTCAVVASADDKSSHQIHLYGGHRPEDSDFEPIIDNYYILSIPQFVWTRAPSIPKPRTLARCGLLGTHRMVITGGARQPGVDCSTLIKILDLSTGQVINTFGDNANYTVPNYVVSDIGGGGSGGASMTRPIGGFVDGLEAVLPSPSNHNDGGDGDGTDGDNQAPHAVRKRLGAVVGGAVGGAVLAALLLCAFLVWRRRSARPEQVSIPEPVQQPVVHHELPNTEGVGVYELSGKKE